MTSSHRLTLWNKHRYALWAPQRGTFWYFHSLASQTFFALKHHWTAFIGMNRAPSPTLYPGFNDTLLLQCLYLPKRGCGHSGDRTVSYTCSHLLRNYHKYNESFNIVTLACKTTANTTVISESKSINSRTREYQMKLLHRGQGLKYKIRLQSYFKQRHDVNTCQYR